MGVHRLHVKGVAFIFHNRCNCFPVKGKSDIINLILMLQILQGLIAYHHVAGFPKIHRFLNKLRVRPAKSKLGGGYIHRIAFHYVQGNGTGGQ